MTYTTFTAAAATALALVSTPALAQSAGDWTLGFGLGVVDPKANNGKLSGGTLPVKVDENTQATFTFEYFIADNLGVELLAATPFQHNISITGLGKVGSTKHLPPTLSLQYHFNGGGTFSPFLGAGVNYTTFFDESTTGALAGSKLSLGDSAGLAAHAGVDFKVSPNGAIRADLRWMDIDSTVKLNGAKIGKTHIDPMVYGLSYVLRF